MNLKESKKKYMEEFGGKKEIKYEYRSCRIKNQIFSLLLLLSSTYFHKDIIEFKV